MMDFDYALKKILTHYISQKQMEEKIKYYQDSFVVKNYKGRDIELYYDNKIFIKIDKRFEHHDKYKIFNEKIYVSKFIKEILINNIIRNKLPNHAIKIHNYYFTNERQILIMENIKLTLKDFIIKNKHNYKLLNNIFSQLFVVLGYLYDEIGFFHYDLTPKNILIKKINHNVKIKYNKNTYKFYDYVPILIDFSTSFIINNKFSILNCSCLETTKYLYDTTKLNDYKWCIKDKCIGDYKIDIHTILHQINKYVDITKIPIIIEYMKYCKITLFDKTVENLNQIIPPHLFISKSKIIEKYLE